MCDTAPRADMLSFTVPWGTFVGWDAIECGKLRFWGGSGSHPDEGGKFGRVHVLAGVAFGCGEGHLPTWETEKRDDEWMFASFNGSLLGGM